MRHTSRNFAVLESLSISGTLVADSAVKQLAERLSNLAFLDLSETAITDHAVASLARLSKLRGLLLRDTRITDASVPHLLKLKSLEQLDIRLTEISPAGSAKLIRAFPQGNITF